MKTESLNYHLPAELIAQHPARERSQSRLLVLDRKSGKITDRHFDDLIGFLRSGDCLVLNNTRVLPARFQARRHTGGRIEGLFLGLTKENRWEVLLKNAQRLKEGEVLNLCDREGGDFAEVRVIDRGAEGHWIIEPVGTLTHNEILDQIGFAPLPPYIKRSFDAGGAQEDLDRYQTVFAEVCGAVAAPTAGLHFTETLLGQIQQAGIRLAHVTLHVGEGTFKPVTESNLEDHAMHWETFSLGPDAAQAINETKEAGGRVVAVGTTCVRTLETVGRSGRVQPSRGRTKLFIKPGFEFKIVDAIVTNFHLPKSTLLALVAAFAGLEETLAAYRHAVDEKYRFYSYGDAMLIL